MQSAEIGDAKVDGAVNGRPARPFLVRLSGVSLLAASSLLAPVVTTAARASDQTTRVPRASNCAALGEGFVSMQGVEGCLRVGGHVRVESQVMRGAASLGAGLPNAYAGDGASPAGVRTESAGPTSRLRMRPMPGDLFSR